jgi:hypothetical protein
MSCSLVDILFYFEDESSRFTKHSYISTKLQTSHPRRSDQCENLKYNINLQCSISYAMLCYLIGNSLHVASPDYMESNEKTIMNASCEYTVYNLHLK